MRTLHRADDRFHSRTSWLDSRHSFSFAEHFDPDRMGFGPLRVLNEDRIAPRSGFPPHAHRDMEILTWVISGELTHEDSEGHRASLAPGRLQRMRAGRGIVHSEMNRDPRRPLHLLQIWIEPAQRGLAPGHEERTFKIEPGEPTLLASPDGTAGSLAIAQDARVFALRIEAGKTVALPLDPGRRAWLQLATGGVEADALELAAGDALALEQETGLALRAREASELLVFDLPA